MRTYLNIISQASSDRADMDDCDAFGRPAHTAYEKGAIIVVRAHDLGESPLTLRIIRVYRPSSYACVMAVEALDAPSDSDRIPQYSILKLFDRRFATKLRNEHGIQPWSRIREDSFLDFVDSGEAATFFEALQQPDFLEEPASGWSAAENETQLQSWCFDMFATELEIYRHLEALQGNQIPKLFSSVSLSIHSHMEDATPILDDVSPLLHMRGLLMEHVVGDTFLNMPDFVPRKHWQNIFDEGLKVIHTLADYRVVNEGIEVTNFVASPTGSKTSPYRVVMVGFAHCNVQSVDQPHIDWVRLKADVDEEGTIGEVMSTILKKVGFSLRYTPSNRFAESESVG